MSNVSFPLLSFTILLPLLGAIITGITCNINLAKKITLIIASFELVLTLSISGTLRLDTKLEHRVFNRY